MGALDPIVQALNQPGPQTDHSTHTTTILPPVPDQTQHGAIHTNQKKAQTGDMELLRSGKNGPRPY